MIHLDRKKKYESQAMWDPTSAKFRFTVLFFNCLLTFGSYFCFDVSLHAYQFVACNCLFQPLRLQTKDMRIYFFFSQTRDCTIFLRSYDDLLSLLPFLLSSWSRGRTFSQMPSTLKDRFQQSTGKSIVYDLCMSACLHVCVCVACG